MRLPLQVISSFVKFCVTRTFWVELRPDVVLEVAGSKFPTFYKDDCFTNDGDIYLFELWKRRKKKKNEIYKFSKSKILET